MSQISQNPLFTSGAPSVQNSANALSFSLPIFNIGAGAANNLLVTGIVMGSAVRQAPVLPIALKTMASNSVKMVNAGFDSTNLVVGKTYLATVHGTFETNGITYAFAVNRPITIPAATVPQITFLSAHVTYQSYGVGGVWSYTIFNDEAAGSPQYISAISMDVDNVSFNVTGAPPNWAFETDNLTYILWYSMDQALPYASHIAPGASLGGFQIQSTAPASEGTGLTISAWNHQTDSAGLLTFASVPTPSQI